MTYQGERARPMADENNRFFEVSKVRIGADGHVSDVLWGEVNAGSDLAVGHRVVAVAADVVDAIHDGAHVVAVFPQAQAHRPHRTFVVVEHEDGRECIALEGNAVLGREVGDLDVLED